MLTQRQKLTLQHLSDVGIFEKEKVIEWCLMKIKQPKRAVHKSRVGRRKFGRGYYFGILEDALNRPTEEPTATEKSVK